MGRTNRGIRDRILERGNVSGAFQAARAEGIFPTAADIRRENLKGLSPNKHKVLQAFSSSGSGNLSRAKVRSPSTSRFYRLLTKLP